MEKKLALNYSKGTRGYDFSLVERIPLGVGLVLFFLMLVFPRSQQIMKFPFLAFSLFFVFCFVSWRVKISKWVLIWFAFFIFYGLFWGLWGVVNSKEFAIDFLRLNFGWVLLYALLIMGIRQQKHLRFFLSIFPFAVFLISLLGFNFLLHALSFPHVGFLLDLDPQQRMSFHPGYTQITSHNIGSLFFLMPYLFSNMLLDKTKLTLFNLLFFLCGVILVFLSGRRMLWLVFLFIPFLHFSLLGFIKASRESRRSLIWTLLCFVLLLASLGGFFFGYLGWDVQYFVERFAFKGDQSAGAYYRANKIDELVGEVVDRSVILLGTGGGSPAFEVTPVQVFHETGMLGTLLFLGLFFSVFLKVFFLLKKKKCCLDIGLPLLCGGVCFFLSIFTNPYFSSFDFMWTLFLLVAFVNINSRKSFVP